MIDNWLQPSNKGLQSTEENQNRFGKLVQQNLENTLNYVWRMPPSTETETLRDDIHKVTQQQSLDLNSYTSSQGIGWMGPCCTRLNGVPNPPPKLIPPGTSGHNI